MAEDVREARDVLEFRVMRPGEEVPQVVGKDLLSQYLCRVCLSIFQTLERSTGFPVRVTNTGQLTIPCSR